MSDLKIRLLFISSWFPGKENPTLGNFVEKHLQTISSSVDTILLQVEKCRFISKKVEIQIISNKEYRHVYVAYKNATGFLAPLRNLLRYFWSYYLGWKKVIEEFGKPQLIHASIFYPVGMICLVAYYFFRLPFVISEHWTIYMREDSVQPRFFQKYISLWAARKASYVMPVSESLLHSMKKFGFHARWKVVPNVIDTTLFKPSNTNLYEDAKKQIFHLSSFDDKQKNIEGILQATSLLLKQRSDFILHIAGDGDSDEVKIKALNYGFEDSHLKVSSSLTHSQVVEELNHSAFFVLFSNYESFSIVLAESIACGCPVVTSKCGGLTEIIPSFAGIQVEPRNIEQLCETMNYMLNHFHKFPKEQMHQWICQQFSPDVIRNEFLNIYHHTLSK